MKLPATLIGGYLGAGKTTLVNHLLRSADGLRIAVLVNDFGDINIDADLIESRDGDLINLAGGCVCCSFGSDLIGAIERLTGGGVDARGVAEDRGSVDARDGRDMRGLDDASGASEPSSQAQRPQHLLIEASGVALPAPLASSLRLFESVALEAIVVLADAETIVARLSDRYVGDTVRAQLLAADLIVLNKADLVSTDTLEAASAALSSVAPRARLIVAQRSAVPPAALLGWRDESPLAPAASAALADTPLASRALRPAHAPFSSLSLRFDAPIDPEQLAQSLADPTLGLYRAKALARRRDGTPVVIQVVGARFEVTQMTAVTEATGGTGATGATGATGGTGATGAAHRAPQQGRLMCVGARDRFDERRIRDRLDQAIRAAAGA